jgi:hypothetical protein
MAGFGLIVLGAIIGFNRRDRSKPTSTYWLLLKYNNILF